MLSPQIHILAPVPSHELSFHQAGITRKREEGVSGQDGSYPTHLGSVSPTGEVFNPIMPY